MQLANNKSLSMLQELQKRRLLLYICMIRKSMGLMMETLFALEKLKVCKKLMVNNLRLL